ncbi:hypothetical protein DERF_009009 [Dermatophagoides farinae]|uniref:Uncharacterized protein n=1 Tax=Dermatophagoides farinae TaxID=6954 RepID=A0A922L098_DERFA|nr:hypothetical protein DERF_009009 [Dermatophagoides farinae]
MIRCLRALNGISRNAATDCINESSNSKRSSSEQNRPIFLLNMNSPFGRITMAHRYRFNHNQIETQKPTNEATNGSFHKERYANRGIISLLSYCFPLFIQVIPHTKACNK